MSPVVALLAGAVFKDQRMLHRSGRPFNADERSILRALTEDDLQEADRVRKRLVELNEAAATAWGELSDIMGAYFDAYPQCKTTADVRPYMSDQHREQVDNTLRHVGGLDEQIEEITNAIASAA